MTDILEPPMGWIDDNKPVLLDAPRPQPVIKMGFTVGVYDTGEMLFKFHGDSLGVIELRGLLEFARNYIEYSLRSKTPTLTTDVLHEVQKLNSRLDTIEKSVKKLCDSNKGILIQDDDDIVVNRTPPHLDECKNLLLHVIKQAVDDYQLFRNKTREDHKEAWTTASGLLFNDEHYIAWGGIELNLEQICDILSLDIHWVRNRVQEQVEVKLEADGTVSIPKKF